MDIKWQEVSRVEKKFLDRYKDWLDNIVIPAAQSVLESAASTSMNRAKERNEEKPRTFKKEGGPKNCHM